MKKRVSIDTQLNNTKDFQEALKTGKSNEFLSGVDEILSNALKKSESYYIDNKKITSFREYKKYLKLFLKIFGEGPSKNKLLDVLNINIVDIMLNPEQVLNDPNSFLLSLTKKINPENMEKMNRLIGF
ncbi:hypothetical protein ACFLTH_17495, partial [Bacteroidota bacterium]